MAYKTRDLINKLPNKININYDSFFSSSTASSSTAFACLFAGIVVGNN